MFGCRRCGVPRLFGFTTSWTDDGIILSMPMGLRRLIITEREHMVSIFHGIEEKLGLPIDHILYEAKRKDAKVYTRDVLPVFLGRLLRLAPLRAYGYRAMSVQAALIGMGKFRLLESKPGRKSLGRVHHAYYPALFAGDAAGAFESFEGVRVKTDYGYVGADLIINVEVSEGPEEERLEAEEGTAVTARAGYERCGVCGLPREVADMRWEAATGRILDRRTGEWLFVQGVGAINAIMRELENELGEDIPHLVSELTQAFYRNLKSEHPQVFEDLSFMRVRGIGIPDNLNPTPDELEAGVDIRNGFNGPILAGMVAAICGGDKSIWSWELPAEGIVRVKVTSA